VAAPIGTVVGAAEPRLRLLVLQPTPFCNIDCSYCYLSDRQSRARMSLKTVALACRLVFESPRLDRSARRGASASRPRGEEVALTVAPTPSIIGRAWAQGVRVRSRSTS